MPRGLMLLAWVSLIFIVGAAARPAANPAARALHQLFQEDWEFTLREDPLFATRVGDDRYDDRLPSVTVADFERQLAWHREVLRRLRAIPRSALRSADRLNYDIFERLKRNLIEEYEYRAYFLPITHISGFHIEFPELPRNVPLRTARDYENYIARLRAFRTYTDQHIELLRTGLQAGYALPRHIVEFIEPTLRPHIVEDPEQSTLFEPFRSFPSTVPEGERGRLAEAGRAAIRESVVPAYRAFLEFIKNEYLPKSRTTIAVSDLPNGAAYYRHRIRQETTLDLPPEEIHRIGLEEVRRIRGEMEAILKKVGFQGSLKEFLEFLRTDPRFYVDTPEQLLKEVSYVLKRMDGELPRLFRTLPRTPYGIRPVPDYLAPRTTTAYYMPPPGDGSRAGFYYVNTYNLKSRPLYEIEALSLHEAVPGHHLQIALQQELRDLPPFRRFMGFTAFVEGWALYAERLGLEVGFYQDPYSDFGRLSFEMWRACRLVVDTGIHALGWSRQQAIDFMAENTALTLHNIEAEVDRYIVWPGQALAYKMGELKIRELRRRAEEALGPAFDVREFHDVVLRNGAIPLDVLEGIVDDYIRSKQAPPKTRRDSLSGK